MLRSLLLYLLINPCLALAQDPYHFIEDDRTYIFQGDAFNLHELVIKREMKIIIDDECGVEQWQRLTLPEPLDPPATVIANASIFPEFFLDVLTIDQIKIAVRRDGKVITPNSMKPEREAVKIALRGQPLYKTPLFFHYQLPPLRVGDEIEIDYQYETHLNSRLPKHAISPGVPDSLFEFPWGSNITEQFAGSFRIWFHGPVPKKSCKVRIEYPENGPAALTYPNGSKPHRRYGTRTIIEKWDFEDLPGALDEVGSHPYEELPYVVVRQERPYRRVPEIFKENDFGDDLLAMRVGSTAPRYMQLEDYVEAFTDSTGDSNKLIIAQEFHNKVALEFEYLDGSREWNNENVLELKWVKDLYAGRLNETLKYQLYHNVLREIGLDVASGFLCDRRTGEISSNYYFPKYRNDYCLLPIDDRGRMLFLFPKFQDHGWLAGEMPYYYEGARMQTSYADYKDANGTGKFARNPRVINYIETPMSLRKDNQRQTTARLSLSDSSAVTVSFQISLYGQYSTTMRDLYIYNEQEPFVHEHYQQKWWDVLEADDVVSNARLESKTFPFPAKVNGSFHVKGQSPELRVGQWCTHKIDVIEVDRHLDYFPDFVGDDRYILMIQLPDSAAIQIPQPIEVENAFGSYVLRIEPKGMNALQLTSWLAIKQSSVTVENIDLVREVYGAVLRGQQAVLEVQ